MIKPELLVAHTSSKLEQILKKFKIKSKDKSIQLADILVADRAASKEKTIVAYGTLEILPDGYGFLRKSSVKHDVYISASQIKKLGLRNSDFVVGEVRKPVSDEKNFAILTVLLVNGKTIDKAKKRSKFDDLEPCYPTEHLKLESKDYHPISSRIVDLIAPIGKGQRGLIVAPPKAGKTIFISEVANSILKSDANVQVWILLVDERPEEVTDIKANVKGAQVFASTFDADPQNHIKITESVLEKAKRLVEEGEDIVILMDSITRLARSYNMIVPSSGKIISGGLDPHAFTMPKRFFGAARNIKNGGSLTIIATALVDTGSRMDDVIYEEFKGTGNMEIHLDRALSELRIFPAINIKRSGTRREELLLDEDKLKMVWSMRRYLSGNFNDIEASSKLISLVKNSKSNDTILTKFKETNGKH